MARGCLQRRLAIAQLSASEQFKIEKDQFKLRQSEEGFLVILTLTNREFEAEGFLAPLPPKLELSFNEWQSAYRQIEAVRSCIAPKPGVRLTPKGVTIHSESEHTLAVKAHRFFKRTF